MKLVFSKSDGYRSNGSDPGGSTLLNRLHDLQELEDMATNAKVSYGERSALLSWINEIEMNT